MKTKLFKSLLIALCAVSFVSCIYVDPPKERPSNLEIKGLITDETGLPLASILIYINQANLNSISNEKWREIDEGYSDSNGEYCKKYTWGVRLATECWPAEISVTAEDPAGVYSSQTKSFPIRLVNEKGLRTDAFVTADFVMKKK